MGRGKAWWETECVALCQAWAAIAQEDPEAAALQNPAFFERLHTEFAALSTARQDHNGEIRSTIATRGKWREISRAVVDFDRHLRKVREEVGANVAAADDDYNVLMKAIARHNGVTEVGGENAGEGGSGSNGDGSDSFPQAVSTSPSQAQRKVVIGAPSANSFEFMSCWQFLRKVPRFWTTCVSDLSKRAPKSEAPPLRARELKTLPKTPVPAGESGNINASGAIVDPPPEPGASGGGFYSGVAGSRVGKRMRTGLQDPTANTSGNQSAAVLVNRNLDALTQAVLARNNILAEANGLALFSLENMRGTPQAQEYFEMSAGLHLAQMRQRVVAATQERASNEVNQDLVANGGLVALAPAMDATATAARGIMIDVGDDSKAAIHEIAAVSAAAADGLTGSGGPTQQL